MGAWGRVLGLAVLGGCALGLGYDAPYCATVAEYAGGIAEAREDGVPRDQLHARLVTMGAAHHPATGQILGRLVDAIYASRVTRQVAMEETFALCVQERWDRRAGADDR